MGISIHALREEGDLFVHGGASLVGISIHALREEGDGGRIRSSPRPSISIHALREEGDADPGYWYRVAVYFYPRPP